jgi:hypothetical protein
MKTAKQTAANNKLLAQIKKIFNQFVFKKASQLMNEQGTEACLAYIGTMFNDESRAKCMEEFNELAGTTN